MKIATWNLERVRPGMGARSARIRSAIASIEADVWVLTETHVGFRLPDPYEAIASSSTATDRGPGEQWVSIWARRSLGAQCTDVNGEPNRSAAILISQASARGLLVFGTVLPWRGDRSTADRGAEKYQKSLAAQTSDWRRLVAAHGDADICVAGDFNQELSAGGPVGTHHGRAALADAFETNGLTCVTSGDRDPLKKWRASIDHVVLSRQLAARALPATFWPDRYPLPKIWPDHYGVCVEIQDAESRAVIH